MKFSILMFFILISTIGCSHKKTSPYKASDELYLSSIHWDTNDLKEISKKMVQKILSSDTIDFSENRFYSFRKIRNDSYDQIDTKALSNKIITSLVQSKKLTFVNENKNRANYIFHGKISSIFKKNNQSKDIFFTFNLTLTNTQTATIIWSHDVEIRKVYQRALIGW